MIIESPEFRKEDGTRIIVRLIFHENYGKIQFRIYDIRYCESRKRTWKSLETSFRDKYEYRQLEQDERRKHEIEKYIEFVGKDKLEEAIMQAWESMKPNIEEIFS